MTTLSWICVITSIIANVFVIYRSVIGQWLWTIANFGLIGYNLWAHTYSQAFLFSVYLVLSIWGVIRWSKKKLFDKF